MERVYEYWFARVKRISSEKKRELRSRLGTGKEIYYIEETALKEMGTLNGKEQEALLAERKESVLDQRKREWEEMRQKRMSFTFFGAADYPERLKEIYAPPYALYGLGKHCFSVPEVTAAIVGARNASPYGLKNAYEYGKVLSGSGIYIISGMARGVDANALFGAVEKAGTAGAVLGCGADVCYPGENRALYERLMEDGMLLSEYPPGTPPLARHFPPRNRIISGLSDIILVMEAKERSGSLITADFALEQGKDVYALPGPVTSALSRGTNRLIRQGADILLSPEELLNSLPYKIQKTRMENFKISEENEIKLESLEKLLYSFLSLYPKSMLEIEEELHIPRGKAAEALLNLELSGWIQEISKNYYIRLK